MTKSKITSEGLQGFCNQQIDLSLKSVIAINDPFGKPLKKLVGFATYDGASYSKDEDVSWIQDFKKMDESIKNTFSDIVQLQEKLICEKLISNRDKALEELVRKRLFDLDHRFKNDESFYNFIKYRLTRISDKNNNEYIYLDYISESNKGILLVTFSSKIDYDYDTFSGKITMSIG